MIKQIKRLKKASCSHKNYTTSKQAHEHLAMEWEALEKGEGTIMTAGLSNIYAKCIEKNKNYCFNCRRFF